MPIVKLRGYLQRIDEYDRLWIMYEKKDHLNTAYKLRRLTKVAGGNPPVIGSYVKVNDKTNKALYTDIEGRETTRDKLIGSYVEAVCAFKRYQVPGTITFGWTLTLKTLAGV